MQHIASRESLIATNSHLLSVADSLDTDALNALGTEVDQVSDLLLNQVPLRRTLSEGTLDADTRVAIAQRLLSAKIGPAAMSVVEFAVRQSWSSSRDLQDALRKV